MAEEQQSLSIEESFAQLNQIIEKLQSDSVTLEDSFALYKEGITLVENCSQKIEKIQCDIERINAVGEE